MNCEADIIFSLMVLKTVHAFIFVLLMYSDDVLVMNLELSTLVKVLVTSLYRKNIRDYGGAGKSRCPWSFFHTEYGQDGRLYGGSVGLAGR